MLSWEEQGITDGIDLDRLKNCLKDYNFYDSPSIWLPESNPMFAALLNLTLLQNSTISEDFSILVSSTTEFDFPESFSSDLIQNLPEAFISELFEKENERFIPKPHFFNNFSFEKHNLKNLLEYDPFNLIILSDNFLTKTYQEKLDALVFLHMVFSKKSKLFFLVEDEDFLAKQCFFQRSIEAAHLFEIIDSEEINYPDLEHYKALAKISKKLSKSYREKTVELDHLSQSVENYNQKLKKSNEELFETNKKIADSFSELKKANTLLKNNEAFINAVFQVANVGLSIIDKDGSLLRVNREFCNIYLFNENELISKKIDELIPESDTIKLIKYKSKDFNEAKVNRFTELKNISDVSNGIRKDGNKIMVLNSTTEVVTGQGEKFYINTVRDITKSNRDLLLLHDTLNSLNIGGWEYDIHLKQLFYTEEITNILEIEHGNTLQVPILMEYIALGSREALQQSFVSILKKPGSFVQEIKVITAKKSIKYLKLTARTIIENNTILKLSGTVQDITSIKIEEQKVKENKQLYNALTTNFPGGTIDIINDKYEYIFTGGKELEDLPQSPEEVVGKTIYEIYTKPLAKKLKVYLDKCLNGNQLTFDISYEGKYWNVYAVPLNNENNVVDKVMLLSQNITQQRKADKGLKETHKSLSDFRKALDIASMVAILNDQGEISYMNDNLKRLSGYQLDEVSNKSIDFLLDLDKMVSSFFEEIKEFLFEGEIWKGELVGRNKNGNTFWLSMAIIPFMDENGEPYQFLAVGNDDTTRKITEEQLKVQNKELIRINGELDRFVYSTSHDLRSPLVSVLGLLNIARLEIEPGGTVSTYLDMIEKSVKKLDGFVQEIIDYSQNARLEVKYEKIDFEDLFSSTVSKLQQIDGASKIDFQIKCDLDTPFYSDNSRIAVILNNLITNSIIYRSTRRDDPFVEVRVKANKNFALIEVEDNGKGISNEYIDNVFDMFFKATTFSSGSGLGLYIVKESVNILEGEIEVYSIQNEGTTFILKIPNGARNIEIIS